MKQILLNRLSSMDALTSEAEQLVNTLVEEGKRMKADDEGKVEAFLMTSRNLITVLSSYKGKLQSFLNSYATFSFEQYQEVMTLPDQELHELLNQYISDKAELEPITV